MLEEFPYVQGASIPCKVSRPPGQATYADVARAPAVGSLGRESQGTCSLRDMRYAMLINVDVPKMEWLLIATIKWLCAML